MHYGESACSWCASKMELSWVRMRIPILNYGVFDQGNSINYRLNMSKNGVLIKVHKGKIEIEGTILREKDEIGIEDFESIAIKMLEQSEIMIFEVQMENYAI